MKLRYPILLAAMLLTAARTFAEAPVFRLEPSAMICCEHPLRPLAEYLSEHIGIRAMSEKCASNGAIVLRTDTTLAPEAFRLRIHTDRVEIAGGSYAGVFNGIQELFEKLPSEVYAKACRLPLEIPCLQTEQAPRFAYRGMMLDVARTWMDEAQVKRYINLLSYHRINKLHIHLSDDEGWRIEIKSQPELTAIGGFRGGDSPVRPVYGKWNEKYGGYYTQEQMRSIIAYAAARNIEIIPEIDLPGHSRNLASVHPEIRCNFPPDTVSTNGYDYRSAWCVAREQNYALLENILSELCELFPSPYIHVGGDEVDMTQWKQCPDCQALMRRRGMTDPHQLEDLFMERAAGILAKHGKLPGVWNEAVNGGGLDKQSLVYGWQSVKACQDAASEGYSTVVMPGEYFYFDMRQSPREDGHEWAAIFDAKKVYGFDFAAKGFTEEQMRNVIGLEGAFFSELYISHEPEKPDYLDYMLFPRVCALSQIAWGGNAEGWDTYYRELKGKHYDRMAAMDIRFRLFPPKLSYKEGVFTATTDDRSEIYYLVGDSPEEHRYTRPVRAAKPHQYRFFSRYKTARSPYVADKSYYRTIVPAWKLTTSMGENEKFPYANAEAYKSAARTRRACGQGDWILYTFDTPVRCREMVLQTGHKHLPKTIFTTGYAEVSFDGVRFTRAADLDKGAVTLRPERPIKAVRIISTCDDNGTPEVNIQPPQIKPIL